ncbi:MAG: diphthamide synthesis protein [Nanoarchaeota archaeon]
MRPKILYVELKKKFENEGLNLHLLDKIPGKTVSLASVIQYISLIPIVKDYLEKKGKKIIIKKGAYYPAHVIGCNATAFDKNSDTLLLISDGKFHAINNALQLNREIYVFNTNKLEKISKEEIDKLKIKSKAKLNKFFLADKVGILISIKPGQNYKKVAIDKLISRFEKLNKKVYLFESDNINPAEFENFSDIQIWINTACPGLSIDDARILNLCDIISFLSKK